MHWIDPASLPATEGSVTQWLMNPSGELEGFVLDGQEQVHFPPHLSKKAAKAFGPGDAVRVRAVRPRGARMLVAIEIERADSSARVVDEGPEKARHAPPAPPEKPMEAAGRVKMSLRGPRGELRGALLEDGTALWVDPSAAEALGDHLVPGAQIRVWGKGVKNKKGRAVEVDEIALEAPEASPSASPAAAPVDSEG